MQINTVSAASNLFVCHEVIQEGAVDLARCITMFDIGPKRKRTNSRELILVGVEKTKDLFENANAGNLNRVLVIIQIKREVAWRVSRWIAI